MKKKEKTVLAQYYMPESYKRKVEKAGRKFGKSASAVIRDLINWNL